MNTLALLDRFGRRLRLAALTAALGLSACGGGGGGDSGVGSGGTGSFAVGPISGFGSIIVNGIRYDDDGADVFDDDGNAAGPDALGLGMVVEVTGSAITAETTGSTARASTIRFASEIVGPVETIDIAGRTLTVLGQEVRVTATTVFDGEDLPDGFGSVEVDDVLEVYGLVDASGVGTYTATRIERKGGTVDQYRLRGLVRDAGEETFRIGNTLIAYGALNAPRVADGELVRVRLGIDQIGGAYPAERLRGGTRPVEDRDEAEIEGLVTSVEAGNARRFSIDGIPVDATNAEFDDGSPADLAVGVRVEVEGRLEGGVLIAREVELEDDEGGGGSGGGDDDDDVGVIKLEGLIGSLDTVGQTFVLRGVTVNYGGATFDDGGVDRLDDGDVDVEVEGRLGEDGVTVNAIEVDFED